MKKEEEKVFFVHPKNAHTNGVIFDAFGDVETRRIGISGKLLPVCVLTHEQVSVMDESRVPSNLKYEIYENRGENGYRLRGEKKPHVNADSAKMIRILGEAKKIPRKKWEKISRRLKNSKGETVILTVGDKMLYFKKERTLCILKGGGELLTCDNAKGFVFESESEVFRSMGTLSALAGLNIERLDHFDHIIFTIAPKARTRKK